MWSIASSALCEVHNSQSIENIPGQRHLERLFKKEQIQYLRSAEIGLNPTNIPQIMQVLRASRLLEQSMIYFESSL